MFKVRIHTKAIHSLCDGHVGRTGNVWKHHKISTGLTCWGQNKMTDILQTTFPNTVMRHWNLGPKTWYWVIDLCKLNGHKITTVDHTENIFIHLRCNNFCTWKRYTYLSNHKYVEIYGSFRWLEFWVHVWTRTVREWLQKGLQKLRKLYRYYSTTYININENITLPNCLQCR